ncbi:MAG: Fe2+-dependent dioxygenase [Rhodobacteraceae bacterium]|nr:Fe2+-dependent dioxygenase [Paracoccaceae bacterium]
MPIVLDDLLTPAELAALREAAAALPWEDGARTAGTVARTVKQNEQAAPGPATQALLDKVQAALQAHPLFQAVAYPRAFARLMATRTRGNGHYGPHVDNALIAGARADVSLTLFLSAPDTYEGGALVIADRVEERAFKLPAGSAVVYPATTLHHVQPVTDGTRLVVVGWVQSWVRDPAQREILFDLWRALAGTDPADEQARLLSKTRSNLLRMWAG